MSSTYDGYSSDPDQCTATHVDWASLIITIITVNVTWWLFDIPKLWKLGIGAYFNSICWQCFRLCLPGIAASFAVYHARTPSELPKIYYFGFNPDDERPPMTTFEYVKSITTDTLTIIATCLTIYKTCHMPVGPDGYPNLSGWDQSVWIYPSLPIAIYGLYFLAISKLNVHKKWVIVLGALIVVGLVGTAFTLVLALLSPLAKDSQWGVSLLMYAFEAIPWSILFCYPAFDFLVLVLSVIVRVGGVAFGAMASTAFFPFCQLKNKAFGGVYLAFGILAAIFALYSRFVWGRDLNNFTLARHKRRRANFNSHQSPRSPLTVEAVLRDEGSKPQTVVTAQ